MKKCNCKGITVGGTITDVKTCKCQCKGCRWTTGCTENAKSDGKCSKCK